MLLIDWLYSIGKVRRVLWRQWYALLTRKLRNDEVLFLNYAFEEEPPMGIPLAASEEPNRACIQLYHHVAAQSDLAGKRVLEISCGHGGGASYVARTFKPQQYIGLDLNPVGIRFCREKHAVPGLEFTEGDAENLPFPAGSFEAVINIEASHCYASFPRFLEEVARVLKPGGHFLYADFRFAEDIGAWDESIANAPLTLRETADISSSVLRGMAMNSARSKALVQRRLPKVLHKAGSDFAGVKGSRVYNALQNRELSYRSYHFESAPVDVPNPR